MQKLFMVEDSDRYDLEDEEWDESDEANLVNNTYLVITQTQLQEKYLDDGWKIVSMSEAHETEASMSDDTIRTWVVIEKD